MLQKIFCATIDGIGSIGVVDVIYVGITHSPKYEPLLFIVVAVYVNQYRAFDSDSQI